MIAATHIQQMLAVGREGELGDFLPVVTRILRDLARPESRPVRDPHIAHALEHAHEGDRVPFFRGLELRTNG